MDKRGAEREVCGLTFYRNSMLDRGINQRNVSLHKCLKCNGDYGRSFMKMIMILGMMMLCSSSVTFAQSIVNGQVVPSNKTNSNDKCKWLECPLGSKTSQERAAYNSAAKGLKTVEKQERKQQKNVKSACAPTVWNDVRDVLRNPFTPTRCDAEKQKLSDLNTKKKNAQFDAGVKAGEYDAAKRRTGSWR
jgi:hypothetical protein